MEPDKNNPIPNKDSEISDLHAEGIDLVGSSVALDNEFSSPEKIYAQTSGRTENIEPEKDTPVKPRPVVTQDSPEQVSAEVKKIDAIPQSKIANTPSNFSVPNNIGLDNVHETDSEKKPEIQNDPTIKPLRTFKTDAEEAIRYGNVSKATIAIAEQKKRDAEKPIEYEDEKQTSPILYVVIAILAILILLGGWYFWFNASGQQSDTTTAPIITLQTPIPYAKLSSVVLVPGNNPLSLIASKLSAVGGTVGTITAIAPIASSTATGITPLSDILQGTHIPDRLLRSLTNDYMIGLYVYDVQGPFIILKNTFFQNAYSGMLEWEKDLPEDMYPLIHVSSPDWVNTGTATFEDGVVSNIDTRSVRDDKGNVVLTYAFANNDTMVIATTQNTLKYILDRLLQVRTIQ